ncbi:MAG: TatD family hydrolase [Phycisphaerales bacterium]
MYDTHCHLTFDHYDEIRGAVLDRAVAAGVRGVITVSTTSDDALRTAELAASDPRVWCTAGVHPLYSDQPVDWSVIRACAARPRCVAWGELGLDGHYDRPPKDVQLAVLTDHLEVIESARADGIDKPVVVHCRKAFDALIPRLAESSIPPDRFVFHCFTGTPDNMRALLDFGASVSFTGVVTFGSAPEVREAAKLVPDDRVMVETDAPFLAPEPHRKQFPNEPALVVHVARTLAKVRGVDASDFERTLDANAERFFGLSPSPASTDDFPGVLT